MVVLIPVLICILGALVYGLTANPKVAQLGVIAYGCGLLVTLLVVAGHKLAILP